VDPERLLAEEAMLSRRTWLLLSGAVWAVWAAPAVATGPLPPVLVYAPSPCLACIDWADHLRQHGFVVTIEDKPLAEMARIKRWLNVPSALESVHTAQVAGYFVEGHVPAEDLLALLKEKPPARGLAVPGLPRGAPGREKYSPVCDTACTILDNAGQEHEVRPSRPTSRVLKASRRTSCSCPALSKMVQAVSHTGLYFSRPGAPRGRPGTARPRAFGFSFNSASRSSAGTWPSTK
jgi:hypothetical protein